MNTKKTIWAHVSIEVDEEEGMDDETLMDFFNDDLVEQGYIVDDMGIRNNEETK
jgi:hypothetical protein